MTLVDTNVFLDIVTDDPLWFDWSFSRLEEARLRGGLIINDVIYAELAVPYDKIEDLDWAVRRFEATHVPIPREALFLAAGAYGLYRRSGVTRSGVLPDFFIGAHASVSGLPLLTRDARRYRTYFPQVQLITPGKE